MYYNGPSGKTLIYRSEVIMGDLDPVWKPFELNVMDAGGPTGVVFLEFWDWDADGNNDRIGECTIQTSSLTQQNFRAPLGNLAKLPKKNFPELICKSGKVFNSQSHHKAHAVRIKAAGTKLEKKDGLLGKSGKAITTHWLLTIRSLLYLVTEQCREVQVRSREEEFGSSLA